MKRLLLLAPLVLAACSGNSPTAPTPPPPPPPIQAASVVTPSGGQISLPGCNARQAVAASLGLSQTTCLSFQGPLVNNGLGCAINVRGTLTIYTDAAGTVSYGSAEWTYPTMIRAGESVTYTGGAVVIPTTGAWYWRSIPTWTNSACS